jgi:hypothetical protein
MYINTNLNGWSESYICNIQGNAANPPSADDFAFRLVGARRAIMCDEAYIAGVRVQQLDVRGSGALSFAPNYGMGPGAKAGPMSDPGEAILLGLGDATNTVRATVITRGWPALDTSIGVNQNKLNAARTPGQVAWKNALTTLLTSTLTLTGGNSGRAVIRSYQRDPAIAIPVDVELFTIVNDTVTIATASPVLFPAGSGTRNARPGDTVKVVSEKGRCVQGVSGTYRITRVVVSGGVYTYSTTKKVCCVSSDLSDLNGTIQPYIRAYVPITYVTNKYESHRNTGPTFFSGRGRRRARCC